MENKDIVLKMIKDLLLKFSAIELIESIDYFKIDTTIQFINKDENTESIKREDIKNLKDEDLQYFINTIQYVDNDIKNEYLNIDSFFYYNKKYIDLIDILNILKSDFIYKFLLSKKLENTLSKQDSKQEKKVFKI